MIRFHALRYLALIAALTVRSALAGDGPVAVDPVLFRPQQGAAIQSLSSLGRSLIQSWTREMETTEVSPEIRRWMGRSLFRIAFEIEHRILGARSLMPAQLLEESRQTVDRISEICQKIPEASSGSSPSLEMLLADAACAFERVEEAAVELGAYPRR